MTFGVYLRQLREEKALRQSDLAEAIGVSAVYVCDIEKDRRYPPVHRQDPGGEPDGDPDHPDGRLRSGDGRFSV